MKLLLTSAWNPRGAYTLEQVAERRARLKRSLDFYRSVQSFDQIIVADATMTAKDAASVMALMPARVRVITPKVEPTGSFTGPSYLEALLYIGAAADLRALVPDAEMCLKITGGYIVKNIEELAKRFRREPLEAVGFLHQNPLRWQPRFAMTSFMGMQAKQWQGFIQYLKPRLDDLRSEPLESVYRKYLIAISATRGQSLPYPRLDAYSNTGKMHTSSLKYRLREIAWRGYSRAGLFVLTKSS